MNDPAARGKIAFGKHFLSHKNIFSHLEEKLLILFLLYTIFDLPLQPRSGSCPGQCREVPGPVGDPCCLTRGPQFRFRSRGLDPPAEIQPHPQM